MTFYVIIKKAELYATGINAGIRSVCIILNGFALNVGGMISEFADDMKIGHVVDSQEDSIKTTE